jgi:hypothetical protein
MMHSLLKNGLRSWLKFVVSEGATNEKIFQVSTVPFQSVQVTPLMLLSSLSVAWRRSEYQGAYLTVPAFDPAGWALYQKEHQIFSIAIQQLVLYIPSSGTQPDHANKTMSISPDPVYLMNATTYISYVEDEVAPVVPAVLESQRSYETSATMFDEADV